MDDGFLIVPELVTAEECEVIGSAIQEAWRSRTTSSPNRRNLLRLAPEVGTLARSRRLIELASRWSSRTAFPVRALFFDKSTKSNWSVSWHQDLAIAVRERIDLPGFAGWSVKDGVPHVHPPVEVLETMVTIRVHLDDCHPDNGALMVLPGSHRAGKLDEAAIQDWRTRIAPIICRTPRGGAVVMRPLLLHASSPTRTSGHRRVVHIEYATEALPAGLAWGEC